MFPVGKSRGFRRFRESALAVSVSHLHKFSKVEAVGQLQNGLACLTSVAPLSAAVHQALSGSPAPAPAREVSDAGTSMRVAYC